MLKRRRRDSKDRLLCRDQYVASCNQSAADVTALLCDWWTFFGVWYGTAFSYLFLRTASATVARKTEKRPRLVTSSGALPAMHPPPPPRWRWRCHLPAPVLRPPLRWPRCGPSATHRSRGPHVRPHPPPPSPPLLLRRRHRRRRRCRRGGGWRKAAEAAVRRAPRAAPPSVASGRGGRAGSAVAAAGGARGKRRRAAAAAAGARAVGVAVVGRCRGRCRGRRG